MARILEIHLLMIMLWSYIEVDFIIPALAQAQQSKIVSCAIAGINARIYSGLILIINFYEVYMRNDRQLYIHESSCIMFQ